LVAHDPVESGEGSKRETANKSGRSNAAHRPVWGIGVVAGRV
jgi:hypothetical protein